MKFMKQAAVLALSLSTLSGVVHAGDEHFYAGIKAGAFMVDVQGVDDATPFGLQLGYDFGENVSVEFEYNTGEADLGEFAEMDITTMAIYATYRSEGNAYVLAKMGLLKEELEVSQFGHLSEDADESGLSYGLGGGFKLGNKLALEAEYTIVETDVSYLGVTARALF